MMRKIGLFCLIAILGLTLVNCSGLRVRTPDALKGYKFTTVEQIIAMEDYPDYYFKAGPARYLMTVKEKGAWAKLGKIKDVKQEDSGKREFLKKFWQRRDPDLSTKENRFKEAFYYNAIFIKKNFRNEYMGSGWNSDRGKFFLVLGRPSYQRKFSCPNSQRRFEEDEKIKNQDTWSVREQTEEILVWEYPGLLSAVQVHDIGSYFSGYPPSLYFRKGISSGWEIVEARYGEQIFNPIRANSSQRMSLERLLDIIREEYILNKEIEFDN